MNINTNQIVSISEANQNFSRVARMVDKNGEVVIFKNNKPKYRLVDIERYHHRNDRRRKDRLCCRPRFEAVPPRF